MEIFDRPSHSPHQRGVINVASTTQAETSYGISDEVPTAWTIVPETAQLAWSAKKRYFMLIPVDARGSFSQVDGTITFHDESPTGARVEIQIPVASQSSGNKRRDEHLLSADFFDCAQYPEITFVSNDIRVADNRHQTYEVDGTLTVRGNAKSITLTGAFVPGNQSGRAHVSLSGNVNRQEFAITWKKEPMMKLFDEIVLTIEVDIVRGAI